ncbi:centromere-associated protein E isoform X9 [Trematomus bernacchii]|uniref:centromere-associated protein E isoform X9 n=1 Tax=Trematomus bernacchii TaxID=40690 RepID=UPI00146AC2E6|nr:centromere-associated protein E isoform X9 [Trematomus bernacchii]
MAEESAVKVCVRVRPLIPREDSAASENAEPVHYFWKADAKSIYQVDDGNSSKSFSFDRVFTAEETTNQLYQAIAKPLVVSSVQGYNGTIFAYGQTASGKTFTMLGSDRFPGVIPLAVEDVFQTIKSCPKKEFLLRVSYMEIYNETVSDLLIDSWKRQPLEVRETINKTIYVADLREELVTSLAQVLAWIRKGEKNRHYGKTKMNERSSRSHAIFRMILESRERSDPASGENADGAIIVSHLNLVDLAGSERASQTGAEGTRFKEGCNINRSLFTLGHVIKKLTDEGQKGFTNYRDSKLTRILQNSLGGNAKTVIICTITPVTLEETLSTLQFASTAKKMKNDPHVTEVSDEGALLKRYRNEIEDLKRRLQEVSSVTQTTAKEKKSLSQRLQEKDQLQTEQEDRIRNLTKLLVTSSNLVPVQKVPKRRETWGGKMQGLARTSRCDSFTGNRKADLSCLSELCESDKDFDAHWEIPDEPSDEMDMNQTSVTVRSFADSPKDFLSPDRMHELSERVSILMMQLEMETQQKKDALDKLQSTEQRAAQLELELQMEAEQKVKALEQVEILGGRLADIGSQNEDQSNTQMKKEFAETIHLCESLSTEKDMVLAERDYLKQELGMFIEQIEILEEEKALLSQELEEKREVDEFKALEDECRKDQENELQNEMANLKKTVEASELQCLDLQNKLQTLTVELKKKTEFALELQSMSGKDLVQEVEKLQRSLGDAEGLSRDTKKEWAVLRSEHMAVEEMNLILSANHEKMEAEVRSLRCKLDTEKTSFRKMQSDLQKELNVVFDENTKLTSLLDGKVPQNLIDSMELERRVAQLSRELTVSQEAEGELKAQLEELASFQTLPEKVDSLMKQLDELSEELQSVRAEKETLLSEQSAAAQSSVEEMEKLLSAVTSLTAERDQLQGENVDMAVETQIILQSLQDEMQQQRTKHSDLVKLYEQKESVLGEHMLSLSQELESVRAEKETLLSEQSAAAQSSAEEMEKLLSAVTSLTAERDQLQGDLQENVDMMIENQEELRTALEKNRQRRETIKQLENAQTSQQEAPPNETSAQIEELQTLMMENQEELRVSQEKVRVLQDEISALKSQKAELESRASDAEITLQLQELHNQIQTLSEELESVRAERDALLSERTPDTHSEEMETLQCRVTSLSEDRDQLQSRVTSLSEDRDQLQSRVTSLSEDRDQLQSRVTSLSEDRDQLQETLVGLRQEKQQLRDQLEDRMEMIQTLSEELESVRAERDALLSERTPDTHSEEMEKLQSRVTSLSEDRDQLQETLEGLRQQKQQLRDQLEDRMETMHTEMATLNMSLQIVTEQKRKLEDDLQQNMTMASTTQELLKTVQEKLCEQQQMNSELDKLCSLDQQKKTLTDKLESIEAERDAMLSEKESSGQSSTEEMEKLQSRVTSLSEDRDQLQSRVTYLSEERHQLQETLEGLRQEKQQLRDQLEDRMEMIQTLSEELESVRAERDALLSERTPDTHSEEMETLQCRVTSLSEDRDQLQEILEGLRQEKQQLRDQLEDRMEMVAQAECEFNQPEILTSELHVEEVTNLQKEIKQLQDTLQTVSEQKSLLEVDLQRNMEKATETESLLHSLEQQLEEHNQRNIDLETLSLEQQAQLQQQVCCGQSSTEEMEKLQSRVTSLSEDRDQLQSRVTSLSEDRDQLQSRVTSLSEDRDQLQSRVTSLSEDRDQLQETLEGLRQEKQQLRDQLEDRMEMIQTLSEELESVRAERDALLSERTPDTRSEEMEKLQSRVTSLSEDRDQLQETLEGLRQQKQQLRDQLEDRMETMHTEMATLNMSLQIVTEQKRKLEDDLQQNMTMASTTQELLKTVQEKLCEQQQMNSELDKLCQQKESSLDQQKKTLTDKLESIEAERDGMLSEKESSGQSSTEEMEKLQSRVTSLSEERHQLQETLEGLRQEKQQLRDQLEDRMEMVSGTKEKLSEQEQLNSQLREQAERREQETQLQQRLLSDAITTMSVPREQLSSLDQSSSRVKETMTSQLQESTEQLQESFGKFQHFIDACSKYNTTGPVTVERCQFALTKAATQTYNCVYRLQQQAAQFVSNTMEHLKLQAQSYMKVFKELVRKDLAVFKERRALDELLCRVKAQTSVNDKDFHSLWDNQLTELLDKRQLYLQKMSSILGKLWACIASYPSELSTDNTDRECFKEKLQSLFSKPMNFFLMDSILSTNLVYLSELVHGRKMTLKGIVDEQDSLLGGLKLLEAQAEAQLTEERSKITCLLVLQLKQTQDKVKAVNEQLQEAQVKAGHRVSSHKQATQLLQTELQDSLAQVEEKEHAIQTLRSKLRESERKAPPSVVELEKLRSELFKREVEWTSASDKHKQEMQMMNTVLTEKDHSMRKLKQTLRSQQQGEESFLQGEDLHARLTNPRGLVIKSSVQLEKTKLEEEVKRLRLKVTELESLVSSQQAEISKWKSRALKLKGRVQAEVDKPSSPSTPTKRGYFMASDGANFFSSPKKIKVTPRKVLDSPRKVLDSPRKLLDSSKVSALDSPKSRFFDVGGNSELLSRSRPTQFFDNSSLGTTPASVADRRDDVWPLSPKQEEMCKSQ